MEYKTVYLSYPDIAPFLKGKGVDPSEGEEIDWYTLPAIEHGGRVVMGSQKIAFYLEEAFPNTPTLYPMLSRPLAVFVEEHLMAVRNFGVYRLLVPGLLDTLDEAGKNYYIRTRKQFMGPTALTFPTSEEGAKIWEEAYDLSAIMDQTLQLNEGPFLLGTTMCYADMVFMATLHSRRECNSELYEKLCNARPSFRKLYDACKYILQ